MRSKMTTKIDFAVSFLKSLKRLHKKYPGIRGDVQPLIDQLQRGETPGDQIQGVGFPVYKIRIRNTDAQRGKSGGYRVIYYIRAFDTVLLLLIYTKSERENIRADELKNLVEKAEAEKRDLDE
jgi:mRNA-degrading endonuclease RelE of RelBE toxin-antitoxin system